jgi:toxin ParE1/3/4
LTRREYVLTRSAAADLRDIVRYTTATWGGAQRSAYIKQLEDAACEVAEGRGAFKELGSVLPGLRVKAAGRHYIFCLPQAKGPALILAILHERMDLMARLQVRLRENA